MNSLIEEDRHFFRPPTSEKLRGHIGLGLSICPSVMLFGSWETGKPLKLGS